MRGENPWRQLFRINSSIFNCRCHRHQLFLTFQAEFTPSSNDLIGFGRPTHPEGYHHNLETKCVLLLPVAIHQLFHSEGRGGELSRVQAQPGLQSEVLAPKATININHKQNISFPQKVYSGPPQSAHSPSSKHYKVLLTILERHREGSFRRSSSSRVVLTRCFLRLYDTDGYFFHMTILRFPTSYLPLVTPYTYILGSIVIWD